MQPTILTIAGSDSSGGAGIQADLKAIAANGGYGASVITAITAQNTCGVRRVEILAPDLIRAQLAAVLEDLEIAAIKTGMLGDEATIRAIAAALYETGSPPPAYVCDPVMVATSGDPLLAREAVGALIDELLPRAALVTPNAHEAQLLAGLPVRTLDDARRAARRLRARGVRSVLIKGGHLEDEAGSDLLLTPQGEHVIVGPWLERPPLHGTGCTYSAAIATLLGRGLELTTAVRQAKRFLIEAIRHASPVGRGAVPTQPFHALSVRDTVATGGSDGGEVG